MEGTPRCLSSVGQDEARAENSPGTLSKVEGGHRKFLAGRWILLAAFVLVWLVKVGIGIKWLKAVLLPLGGLLKMLSLNQWV